MKAMVMSGLGLDNLKLETLADPVAGPGQVVVKLRSASLNYRDLLTIDGKYGSAQKSAGLIPLSDGAGEIVEVGAGVTEWRVGDRVIGCFFPDWQGGAPREARIRSALGGLVDGVASEYRVFGRDGIAAMPAHLDFVEAAALPCAALTAWSAVRVAGQVGPEHSVLTQGTGGVSLFALQFAVAAGAQVIATSSNAAKLERLGQMGASQVINYREDAEWGRTARKLTGNRGVDLVVEIGGASTFKQSVRATRLAGSIAIIGMVGGVTQEINFALVAMNGLRLQGIAVGNNDQLADMLAAITQHRIRPVVDQVFPLAELPAALAYLKSGQHVGKVCIAIG